jgi:hypothetical protein
MTVAELIKVLSTMNPDLNVVVVVSTPWPEMDIVDVQATKGYYSKTDVIEISA